ncbi:hypothetical protein LB503_000598 [Fusarium chuoi]|nr:hypothetical protein LB503_000598 [Fusarium chuoi]
MTHPTKAIYKWLIQDSVRVGNTSSNPTTQPVYTEQDHLNTFPQIEAIDYHTTHTISSIRITPYPAGHVLGAAILLASTSSSQVTTLANKIDIWSRQRFQRASRLMFLSLNPPMALLLMSLASRESRPL